MCLKISHLRLQLHISGTNGLKSGTGNNTGWAMALKVKVNVKVITGLGYGWVVGHYKVIINSYTTKS